MRSGLLKAKRAMLVQNYLLFLIRWDFEGYLTKIYCSGKRTDIGPVLALLAQFGVSEW
jgi:hypothetical protein